MEIEEKYNPWNVSNLEEFLYYCCPECDLKDVDRDRFLNHIVIAHPRAKNLIESLNEIKDHDFRPELGYKVKVEMPDEVRSDIQESNNRVKCKDCGKSFSSKSKLNEHVKAIHEGIKHKCDICEKLFSYKRDLRRHHVKQHMTPKGTSSSEIKDNNIFETELEPTVKFEVKVPSSEIRGPDLIKQEVIQDEDYFIDSNVNIKAELELDSMDYEDSIQPEVELKELKNELKELKDEKLPSKVVTVHDWQCYLCGLQLKSKNDIMSHIRDEHKIENVTRWMYGEPRTHQCPECKLMFRSVDAYKLHICGPPPPFWFGINDSSCPKCDKKFKTYKELLYHYATVHTKERHFNCDFCDYSAVHPDHVRRHVRDMHKAGDFKCEPNDIFETELEPKVKIEVQGDFQSDNEPNCEVKIKEENQDLIISSVRSVEDQQPVTYKCDICDDLFPNYKELNVHIMNVHAGVPYFKCKQCDKAFSKKQHLKEHISSVHKSNQPPIYKCDQCDKTYGQKRHLDRHIESIHRNVRFNCDKCDKSYSEKESLLRHIRGVHEGIRFQCDQCDKSYIFEYDLRKHYQTAHQGIRYQCDQCDKSYGQKKYLARHKEVVHQTIRYNCDECGKSFTQKGHLNKHMRSVHLINNSLEILLHDDICL